MGRRGPKRTPVEALLKRGKHGEKTVREHMRRDGQLPPAGPRVVRPRRLRAGPAPLVCKRLPPLSKVIRELPGYDPYDLADGYHFDSGLACRAIHFFHDQLVHVKGSRAGQAFILQRWQWATVANLFGWLSDDTGLRRYRYVFIYVGRKNGKSPLAAGLLLYALFEDGEPGAEIYGAASEYKQASLVFDHARGMVQANPRLLARAQIFRGYAQKAIQLHEDYSTYKVIGSDAFSSHGYNTHFAVIDELHTQPDRELVDTLETSTGARDQPIIVYLTTADFDRPSICNQKYLYACKVRDGVLPDAQFLPVIFEVGKADEDRWTDPAVWELANPNAGVSISREYLVNACQKAQEEPAFENHFKRVHLNIRTQVDVRWLRLSDWDACEQQLPELAGRSCYCGLDLGLTKDVSAFAMLFTDPLFLIMRYWIPAANVEARDRRDHVFYSTWARQGRLSLTPGNVTDYHVIRRDVVQLGEVYDIEEIAIDRWNSSQLETDLAGDGFKMVQFGQGFASMTAPTKELEALLLAARLGHEADDVMRWMVSNVVVDIDAAGNLKPNKEKSAEKIDGVVATIMAIGRWLVAGSGPSSVYDERGLTVL